MVNTCQVTTAFLTVKTRRIGSDRPLPEQNLGIGQSRWRSLKSGWYWGTSDLLRARRSAPGRPQGPTHSASAAGSGGRNSAALIAVLDIIRERTIYLSRGHLGRAEFEPSISGYESFDVRLASILDWK